MTLKEKFLDSMNSRNDLSNLGHLGCYSSRISMYKKRKKANVSQICKCKVIIIEKHKITCEDNMSKMQKNCRIGNGLFFG